MAPERIKVWLEGALLAAGQPLTLNQLNSLFDEDEQPGHGLIRQALALLDAELEGRAIELVEVAGGYRLQIRQNLMPMVSRLWTEKPPRYSRALLETLVIIAYRQPITRGEIEQIRGVSLSANILKTLQEREWIKVVGHRDIPGRPELLGTTRAFLDYFGLKGLDDLPTLAEIRDLDNIEPELQFEDPDHTSAEESTAPDPPGRYTEDEQTQPAPEEDQDFARETAEEKPERQAVEGAGEDGRRGADPDHETTAEPTGTEEEEHRR
ncbi:MAG: SMC-Scp complex subunit ScpB [Wenzhouxiangellaceae bacterium]|nr:SMC-Scp complex subunit ScpB [Wenzhouxiangellaceae bacterium]